MTGHAAAVAAVLVALALAVGGGVRRAHGPVTGQSASVRRVDPRRLIPAVVGLVVALAVGGWVGLVVGALASAGVHRWLARRPPRANTLADRRCAVDLPYSADLLAAVLRAGAPPDVAARMVGVAIGGPLGERLTWVSRALRLGTPAEQAWAYLGNVAGGDRLAQAAARSEHSGAAFAGALQRVAEDLRATRLSTADAAARRAGVLIVLPLGLCFLPAFVLAGLVPVIVAVLGDVLSP
jgi:Flp pilus assembly protein TadB